MLLALAVATLAAAPLTFEESRDGFLARSSALDVIARPSRLELSVHGAGRARAAFALELESAHRISPCGEALQPGTHSRFVGPRERWVGGARLFSRVRYAGVYDGIDWVLHASDASSSAQLELDFALAPFADESAIRLRLVGARFAEVSAARVVVDVAGEKLELEAPRAFQDGTPVSARYVRRGSTLGFVLGPHDRSRPVVLDPVAAAAFQYLGGGAADVANAVAVDEAGFVYLAGTTASSDFPTRLGVKAYGGNEDVFVSKLDGHDGGLVYSTFLGGTADDEAQAIALEADGTAVVVGVTNSADFPNGVVERAYDGGAFTEAFEVRLSPSGTSLSMATFLGGTGNDQATAVLVDSAGAGWVAGTTHSNSFRWLASGVVLVNPFVAGTDGFIVEVLPDAGIPWMTYLGGGADENLNALAMDDAGLLYAAGTTLSTDFPATAGSMQPVKAAGLDGFVAVFRQNPGLLVAATHFGGAGIDVVSSMALGSANAVYVGGNSSNTASMLPSARLENTATGYNGFVAKIAPGLTALTWSGVIGANNSDMANGIAVDARDNLYVVGNTSSTLPDVTLAAIQSSRPEGSGVSGQNGFFGVVDPTGTQFVYLSYVGGSRSDTLLAVALGGGLVAVAGSTNSSDVPLTGSAQRGDGGTTDALWLTTSFPPPRITSVSPDAGPVAGGTRVDVSGDFFLPDASVWFGASPATVGMHTGQTNLNVLTPPGNPGTVDVTVVNLDGQRTVFPAAFTYTGMPLVARVSPASQAADAGTPVSIDGSGSTGDSALTYSWLQVDGPTAASFDGGAMLVFTPPLAGTYAFDLTVTDATQRMSLPARATVEVSGPPAPLPDFRPGCSCSTTDASLALGLALALAWRRRRATESSRSR